MSFVTVDVGVPVERVGYDKHYIDYYVLEDDVKDLLGIPDDETILSCYHDYSHFPTKLVFTTKVKQ